MVKKLSWGQAAQRLFKSNRPPPVVEPSACAHIWESDGAGEYCTLCGIRPAEVEYYRKLALPTVVKPQVTYLIEPDLFTCLDVNGEKRIFHSEDIANRHAVGDVTAYISMQHVEKILTDLSHEVQRVAITLVTEVPTKPTNKE